jgi:signal transduction histidine kinase
MAAVDAFSAPEAMELRRWRPQSPAVSWRGLGVVASVALLLSTQIFFQAGLGELLDDGRLIAGWAQYFVEALSCATTMWLALAAFNKLAPAQGTGRALGAFVILFVAAFVAECTFLAAVQPAGFYPSWSSITGDALRWWIWGAIVHAAHGEAHRHARAATMLAMARVERERADHQRAEADLELLQAQIQPHFLFNLFAHVRRLYRVGHDDGRDAAQRLRWYLQEVLRSLGARDTTLAGELELVRAYLDLMKIGLAERLSFTIDADAQVLEARIPPLSVLTLAENAVKHGIANGARAGVVRIAAMRKGASVRIEVRDDGPGVAPSSGNGMGLANTKARLRAMYGGGVTLSLEAEPGSGSVAAIEIASR